MEDLRTILQSGTPVLIDCFATWCGPCKMMPPILQEVKERAGNRLRILKIDIDKNKALASQWHVSGVPTLLLFRDGKLHWRQSGVIPAHQILQAVSPFFHE